MPIRSGCINADMASKLLTFMSDSKFLLCEEWRGYYKKIEYDLINRDPLYIPDALTALAREVFSIANPINKGYNSILIKKYETGDFESPHLDPRRIKGFVISVHLGDYTGGELAFGDENIVTNNGDIVIRRATDGYSMGESNGVLSVHSGTKYIIEFLTISNEENS